MSKEIPQWFKKVSVPISLAMQTAIERNRRTVPIPGSGPIAISTESGLYHYVYTPKKPDGYVAIAEQMLTPEQLLEIKLSFYKAVQTHRAELIEKTEYSHLKPFLPIQVLTAAAGLQAEYNATRNTSPLTHSMDDQSFITERYGTDEITYAGLTFPIRSRGRVRLTSLLQYANTHQGFFPPQGVVWDYAGSGGVTEQLARVHSYTDGATIFQALLNSPYHEPAWKKPYRDLGINAFQTGDGGAVLCAVLGRRLVDIPQQIDTEILSYRFNLPLISMG